MAQQSSIFPIFLRAEYRDGTALQRFQSDAQRAAQAAKREFEGVGAALEGALSRARNSAGSLDLGIDGLRQAAAQQQQVAAAARELAEATKRAATANGQFDASMSQATRAAFQLASAEEAASRELLQQVQALEAVQAQLNKTASATDAVIQAQGRGTTARGSVINSVRAERTAYIQLGQQLQDATVQAQLGTNAFIIMGQQLPQAAFALTGLADSANKTQAAIGRVAQFLSGPWGAAIFVGLAVLGPFVQKLFESKDAADESGRAQRSLSEVLRDTTSSYEEVTKALDDYNRAQVRAQEVTIVSLGAQARAIAENLNEAISIREKTKARISDLLAADKNLRATGDRGAFGFGAEASALQASIAEQDKQIQKLKTAGAGAVVQVATEIARIQSDSTARINAGFDVLAQRAKRSIGDVDKLSARLTQIEKQRQAALDADRASKRKPRKDRSAEVAARAAAREVEQLANLGERAGEQVQRINERFDEQPRLIDQAAQASRQLNAIVRDINTELATSKNLTADQRKEFEGIKTAAAAAQNVIGDALLRPFQDLRRESDERLQINRLLAEGRIDEAAALQEVFRIEQQLGREVDLRARVQRLIADGQTEEAARLEAFIDGYAELKNEAAARVAAEQRVTREYQAQRELLELQADVVRTVGDDLRRLLSGRSTDFVKNFQQAILDLQGARLFEKLFGPTFRALEDELSGNTPQGRANARAAREIETFADTGRRAERALDSLASSAESAASRLNGRGAANDNGLSVPQVKTLGGLLGAALGGGSTGDIVVNGKRPEPQEIATRSVKDIAERIAKETVAGFMGPLEDLLGSKFAGALGGVLSGVLAGYIRGGAPGAVLGGLESITSKIRGLEGITSKLGDALKGAETGTTVGAIGTALGIKGSNTGGQIGGAIGSIFGPVGSLIGSIGGFLIGGLFKSVKKASATIGNLGGSLGVTGVSGSNAAYRDAASGLAGSVVDAVNSVAKQLGATVEGAAGAVSIGQYDKSYVVDPTGRGITKPKKGAIDFGEDAQAAVAFAVRDLIQDGVIKGLKDSENRLLQAAKDVNAGLQDVLTFRSVFDQLKAIKDPVGGAIDSLNREFTSLIDLFNRAGASTEEFAQLQELYDFKRADAIKQATDRVVGSLRSLLNDLKTGDNGLSLRDRQANTLMQYNALAARVAAGDTSAFEDFSNVSKQLLEIERQLFGSTQAYFDRLAQVTKLSEEAIAKQTAGGTDPATAPSPFAERNAIVKSLDAGTAETVSWLKAINDNLIRLAGGGGGGDGGSILNAQRIANY